MTIEDLKKSAAESGICCANCNHCERDFVPIFEDGDGLELFYCLVDPIGTEVGEDCFCADFQPKPQPEK